MKILIVDDSELLQIRLKKALIKADATLSIAQAYTCKQALELFHSFNPCAIILDIALPDGSGMDLLHIFKGEPCKAVIAMLTNYQALDFKEKCLSLGADHFFDKSNLRGIINTIITNDVS